MSAHYFMFSRDFVGRDRLCGECRQTYDDGQHIEINDLKPYTSYVCPNDGDGHSHSGLWTGAYLPVPRSPRQKFCVCGAEFVEEDAERWALSWEMVTPFSDEWKPVRKVASRHETHSQHEGLLQLIEEGEPIRNVVLERAS